MPLCSQCGGEISQGASFCRHCGSSTSFAPTNLTSNPSPTQDGSSGFKNFTKWLGIGCGGILAVFVILVVIVNIIFSGAEEDLEPIPSPALPGVGATSIPVVADGTNIASEAATIQTSVNNSTPISITKPTVASESISGPSLTPMPTANPTMTPTSTPTSMPTVTPTPAPTSAKDHKDLDHFQGRLGPLIADDFDAYCGFIRDEYWHLMEEHESTTFVFVHVAAYQFEFPPNEIARRLTMCGLDLNGEACVGTACDWESAPKLGPDGRIIEPPKFKEDN